MFNINKSQRINYYHTKPYNLIPNISLTSSLHLLNLAKLIIPQYIIPKHNQIFIFIIPIIETTL